MSNDPYRNPEAIERNPDDERVREVLARDLVENEQLLWVGRPKQGVYLSPADLLLIPFSLLWGGFAVSWEVGVISHGAPFFFCLFGLPFVVMGLYIVVGRFFVDARARAHTFYGVTNRRILIVTAGFTRNLTSIDLASSVEVSLEERADGTGTISLGPRSATAFFDDASWPMMRKSGPPALRRVARARDVLKSIRDAQEAQRAKPAASSSSAQ